MHQHQVAGLDVDNCNASVRINVTVFQLLSREKFATEEDITTAAKITGYRRSPDFSIWNKLCSCARPTETCGWASIEDSTEYHQEVNGVPVEALHISSITVYGGAVLGYFGRSYKAFNVLLAKRVGGDRYKRVGVGRVFGKETTTDIWIATRRDIELI